MAMTNEGRERLTQLLAEIVTDPTINEIRRIDQLAVFCLKHAIFEGNQDDCGRAEWRSIWADVMARTGCQSWKDLMQGMPSRSSH
jgi:hypothetical protein